MDRYEIYCTVEQAEKAFELGAPICIEPEVSINSQTGEISPYSEMKTKPDGSPVLIPPTATQMIAWLEEQGILIDIDFYCISWDIRTKTGYFVVQKMVIDSRKEATLAAIDAALKYLTENKK